MFVWVMSRACARACACETPWLQSVAPSCRVEPLVLVREKLLSFLCLVSLKVSPTAAVLVLSVPDSRPVDDASR